jgi:glycosyltransferase involved in cell wall biosynthesis
LKGRGLAMPRVSVIMPSYNHEKFVGESIRGVLNQSYRDLELIVTDDGSSDGTVDVIKQFTDPRIRLFLFEENQGASIATNNCIENARGEYIAVLTSDDVFLPGKVEKQVKFLDEHPDIGGVFGYAQIIDEEGNDFTDPDHFYYNIFKQPNRSRYEWLNHFFYKGNCLCHPSLLIRRECYDTVGLYDPRYAQLPDLDFWIRLCLKYDIHIIPENLIKFRIRAGEANVSGGRLEGRIRDYFELTHILDNYLAIKSREELLKIFPESGEVPIALQMKEIHFLIARLALESRIREYFGLKVMFDLLGDNSFAQEIEDRYGFRYVDFIRLTGKLDPFNVGSLRELEERTDWALNLDKELKDCREYVGKLQKEFEERTEWALRLDKELKERDEIIRSLQQRLTG